MWLIIGYGNLLRQDDGAGYRVAETLAMEMSPQEVRIQAVHQLTPELALELAATDVDRVLFVDAQRNQRKPLVMRKLNPPTAMGSCCHQLSPELLLHMTHSLYRRPVPGWFLIVSAQRMDVGEILSATTRSAMSSAVTLVKNIVGARR